MKLSETYRYMLSVLDKAENGPVLEEKDWDLKYIHQAIKGLIEKYDIKWDAGTMVPSDDALADRLWEAGMELARETGVYCLETKRRCQGCRKSVSRAS